MAVTQFPQIASLLDGELSLLKQNVQAAVDSFQTGDFSTLPLSSGLGSAVGAQFDRFSQPLHDAIADLGVIDAPASVIQGAVNSALGPGGLGFLVDRNGNGAGTDDVLLTDLGGGTFEVDARLYIPLATSSAPLNFGLGLPGLPIELNTTGALDTQIGVAYELAFRYDVFGADVSLDTTKTLSGLIPPATGHPVDHLSHPLAFFVTATPSENFNIEARIGFVTGALTPLAANSNALVLTVTADDINRDIAVEPTIRVDGNADINMRLAGSFAGGNLDFPGIDTDFHLHWAFDSDNPQANPPEVSFGEVYLNLGHFISDVVGPVLEVIQDTTAPLKPVLKILNTPLPGITDLSNLIDQGDVTLLDLAGVVAPFTGYGPLYDLVEKVLLVLDKIQGLQIGNTVRMPLGGFSLSNYDLRTSAPARGIDDLLAFDLTELAIDGQNIQQLGQTFDEIVQDLDIPPEAKDVLGDLTAGLNNGFEIAFPILDDPASAVFNMLLGKDSDLFYVTADAHIDAYGSAVPGLQFLNQAVVFGGLVELDMHFKLAYDTFGLRTLVTNLANGNASDVASDILDGFYIATDSYLDIAGDIFAGIGASFGVVDVVLNGHVSTGDGGNEPVSITIANPTPDGKQRFADFGAEPFALSGELGAGFGIQVQIGKVILGQFIGVRKQFDIAHEVLVTFSPPPPPALASEPDASGEITLYLGTNAFLRQLADGTPQIDGDESFTIRHLETAEDGSETIKITAFDTSQVISGVRSITAVDGVGALSINVLPGVTSNVHFTGGQGPAHLAYRGTGSAVLIAGDGDSDLQGGLGDNQLFGGIGNDTITLGRAVNLVSGGAGHNTIVVEAPVTQNAVISGGDDPGNSLIVIGAGNTQLISATPSATHIDLAITNNPIDPTVHLLVSNIGDLFINSQERPTDITLGDLTTLGLTQVLIDAKSNSVSGRHFELETHAGGAPVNVDVDNLAFSFSNPSDAEPITEYAAHLVNQTTGMKVQLFGLRGSDTFTLHQHGGSLDVDALGVSGGTFVLDAATRQPGQPQAVRITTPSQAEGIDLDATDLAGDFSMTIADYPDFRLHGVEVLDSLSLDVSAPADVSGVNDLDIDASGLVGSLDIDALGGASALNDFTLSAVHAQLVTVIDGLATTTSLHLGTGRLAGIRADVTARNVILSVDNTQAPEGSYLALTATTFGDWVVPGLGLTPRLVHSGLHGPMLVEAGPGDRFQLDVTPGAISSLTITNDSGTLDPVYTANWSVPLNLNGNLALYLGQRLRADQSVERVQHLTQVGVPVVLNFVGVAPTEVVLDAALDAPGAQYTIGGSGNLVVSNLAVGLLVTMNGLRAVDDLRLYVTGATVDANIIFTGPADITIHGADRLAGANPTAANDISVQVPVGAVTLEPLGQYDNLLSSSNPFYVLGSMPQDSLTVEVDTSVAIAPLSANPYHKLYNLFLVGAYYETHGPPGAMMAPYAGRPSEGWGQSPYVSADLWPFLYPYPNFLVEGFAYPLSINSYGGTLQFDWNPYDLNPPFPFPDPIIEDALFFPVNPNPIATENVVRLNASQLRGNLTFNARDPDYSYVWGIVDALNLFDVIETGEGGDFSFWQAGDGMAIAFGRTDVVVSHTNPELAVSINGTTPFPINQLPLHRATVVNGQTTETLVLVAEGQLATIHGDVAVTNAQVTVDDRQGTTPNVLILTQTALTGWQPDGGTTQPALSFDGTIHSDFLLQLSPVDRVGVEDTPGGPTQTLIQNFSSGPRSDIYVMGNRPDRELHVSGNFDLFVGRRLNADGTVDNVGNIGGVTNFVQSTVATHRIFYDYTGQGLGTLVYDASNFDGTAQSFSISPDAAFPGQGTLVVDIAPSTRNKIIFDPNIELFVYGPIRGFGFRGNATIDHRTTALVHYFDNPLSQPTLADEILVWAAEGPVFVQGRGAATRVTLVPQNNDGDLRNTIDADVTVTDAALKIVPDHPFTPVPPLLADVVISGTQVTGLTGATVHFAGLVDYVDPLISNNIQPGLHIAMPLYGAASLVIQDTPAGVSTGINTGTTQIGPVTVAATTGPLWLGRRAVAGVTPFRSDFRAESVQIGDGSVQSILGEISLGNFSSLSYFAPGGTFIDNRLDATPREVAINLGVADSLGVLRLAALAPAPILVRNAVGDINVLGNSDSHYTLSGLSVGDVVTQMRLFVGAGSTVDVFAPGDTSAVIPGMSVYGAQTIHVHAPQTASANQNQPLRVLADPARPNDATSIIADYSVAFTTLFLEGGPDGLGRVNQDSGSFARTHILYEPNNYLTVLGNTTLAINGNFPIRVIATPALHTIVNPGTRILEVRGTTGPLEIQQASHNTVVLGNAGNMQALLGDVTIIVQDAALPNVPIQLNNSADSIGRTIALANPAVNNWIVSGMAPAPIQILGGRTSVSLLGGAQNNTLVGPDVTSTWEINAANGGTLNGKIAFSGMPNLSSGSADDHVSFISGGLIAGNFDGGDGFDTLHYLAGSLAGNETLDLVNNIAPRIGGQALRFEAWDTAQPLVLANPGNRTDRMGAPIAPIAIIASYTLGQPTIFSAANLPPGLAIDPTTGVISGTIADAANTTAAYPVTVSVQSDTRMASTQFSWQVLPGLELVRPADQAGVVLTEVSLPLQLVNNYGTSITYSATNLPNGLSIDADTGVISGTLLPTNSSYSFANTFSATVSATDGTHVASVQFQWIVTKAAANQVILAGPDGGLIQLASPAGTVLDVEVLPAVEWGVDFERPGHVFHLGVLDINLSNFVPGAAVPLVITQPRAENLAAIFQYGQDVPSSSFDWYDWLTHTGSSAAHVDGSQIVINFVDGEWGEVLPSADGTISALVAPAISLLTPTIIGAPNVWTVGVPLTLTGDVAGPLAAGTIERSWQVFRFNVPVASGAGDAFTFTPAQGGFYRLELTATDPVTGVAGLDRVEFSVSNPATTGPKQLGVTGTTDTLSGAGASALVTALDSGGAVVTSFSGPASVELRNAQGTLLFSDTGSFNQGQFPVTLPSLTATGPEVEIYTLTASSNGLTKQFSIVVHGVTRFGPSLQTAVVTTAGQPFTMSLLAVDDRGVLVPGYSGQARLTYSDVLGEHEVGGGYQPVTDSVVTFTDVVLPDFGVYTLTATSSDGLVVGTFVVNVPEVVQYVAAPSSPMTVSPGSAFDFEIIAVDAFGQVVSGFSAYVVASLDGPGGHIDLPARWIASGDQGHLLFKGLTLSTLGEYQLRVSDGVVGTTFGIQVAEGVPVIVASRRIFYNNSGFDGNTPGASPSDASAIDTTKSPYFPGSGAITPASMTNYTKGINGIILELTGPHGTLTAADFTVRMSEQLAAANNTPGAWAAAPTPTVTVFSDTPVAGTDRVVLIFPDGSIVDRYLQVIVEGNDAAGGFNTNTGLVASDIFFYGNKVGDDFTSYPGFYGTDATDEIGARNHQGITLVPTNAYDYNRDFSVDATDQLVARNNGGFMLAIDIANPPAVPVPPSGDSGDGDIAVALNVSATDAKSVTSLGPSLQASLDVASPTPPTGELLFARRNENELGATDAAMMLPGRSFAQLHSPSSSTRTAAAARPALRASGALRMSTITDVSTNTLSRFSAAVAANDGHARQVRVQAGSWLDSSRRVLAPNDERSPVRRARRSHEAVDNAMIDFDAQLHDVLLEDLAVALAVCRSRHG